MSGRTGIHCESFFLAYAVRLMRYHSLINPETGMDVEVEIPNSDADQLGQIKVKLQVVEREGRLSVAVKSGRVTSSWKVQVAGRKLERAFIDGVEVKGDFESEDAITIQQSGATKVELI